MGTVSQLGAVVGNIVGSYFGGPVGGAIGSAAGGYLGGFFDPAIINSGPRFSDLKTQTGSPGQPIAVSFGTTRVAGTIIWITPIRETKHHQRVGGKGSSQSVYNDTYTYDLDFAVMFTDQWGFAKGDDFSQMGITGIRKILSNGALVVSNSDTADIATLVASSDFCESITVYPGTNDQMPDPTMEAALGVGNVPAYRGFSYMVVKGLKVYFQGSPLPQLEAEIVQGGEVGVGKTVFTSYTPQTFPQRVDSSWCGRDTVVSVSYADGDFGVVNTVTKQLGTDQAVSYQFPRGGGHQPRFFTACETAPIMADINYKTQYATDGAVLRLWDMRPDPPRPNGATPDVEYALPTLAIAISNEFTAGIVGYARVAYEEETMAVAYGSVRGPNYDYGKVVMFSPGSVDGANPGQVACNLPANRQMIDIAIYLQVLYVWNFDLTPDAAGFYHTYITAYNTTGVVLFDDEYVKDSFGSQAYRWARLLCNEFGIFTWLRTEYVPGPDGTTRVAGGTQVVRFDPVNGIDVLCTDVNAPAGTEFSAPSAQSAGGEGVGFWTNGAIATMGSTVAAESAPYISNFYTILFKAISKGTVELGYALSTLCRMAGLEDDEFDTSDQTQTLRGYCFKKVGSAASMIEPLCTAFFVEASETDGKVKFHNLGGPTTFDIPYDDLGWSEKDDNSEEPFPLVRAQDVDLPRSLSLVYANWDADFQMGAERPSRRTETASQNDLQYEMPISMTADEAVQTQDVLLYKLWLERDGRTAMVSRAYVGIEPGDVGTVEYPRGRRLRYRARRVQYAGPTIAIELVRDDPIGLVSGAQGSNVQQGADSIPAPSLSALILADAPAFQDGDVLTGGVYAKLTSSSVSSSVRWSGATLVHQDVPYASVGSVGNRSLLGYTRNALADFAGDCGFDESGYFDSDLRGGVTPESVTRDVLMQQRRNAWLVGNEVVFVRSIVPTPGNPSTWRFSGLWRYRRGTADARGTHAVNEPIFLIEAPGLLRVGLADAPLSTTTGFRAVTFGASADRAAAKYVTNTGRSLKALAPMNLRAGVDPVYGTIFVTFNGRTRAVSTSFFTPSRALDEADSYIVDLSATADFAFVVMSTAGNSSDGNGKSPEIAAFSNALLYRAQLSGQIGTTVFVRASQVVNNVAGRGLNSAATLVTLGQVPLPTTDASLILSTSGADGGSTFADVSGYGRPITTHGNVTRSNNRAVFDGTGGYLSLTAGPQPDSGVGLAGFGINPFELRFKFKTSGDGVFFAKRDANFGPGSYRVQVANGRVQFWLGDYSATTPLMQSPSAGYANNVEHEVSISQRANTGNGWYLVIDGVQVLSTGWRNTVAAVVTGEFDVGIDTFAPANFNGSLSTIYLIGF